jgi:hypothetical protein
MHRHFDPTPGQWLNKSPFSFAAVGQNLHPYVGMPKEKSP